MEVSADYEIAATQHLRVVFLSGVREPVIEPRSTGYGVQFAEQPGRQRTSKSPVRAIVGRGEHVIVVLDLDGGRVLLEELGVEGLRRLVPQHQVIPPPPHV
jgi:hypothetical protein